MRDTSVPYKVVVLETNPEVKQTLLGILAGYPDMYEVVSDSPFTLTLTLKQLEATATPTPFSLIVVQENERRRGVTEIARLNPDPAVGWVKNYDSQLALTLLEAEPVSVALGAGIYRFEISTPENIGRYLVEMGSQSAGSGYFASISRVRLIHDFFDVSAWRLLQSSLIFYPLVSMVLLVLVVLTWWYRDRLPYGRR